jgi:hypothetical protein
MHQIRKYIISLKIYFKFVKNEKQTCNRILGGFAIKGAELFISGIPSSPSYNNKNLWICDFLINTNNSRIWDLRTGTSKKLADLR